MTGSREYEYVGPPAIREAARHQPEGEPVVSPSGLARWLAAHPDAVDEGATFTVEASGLMRVAPRRSEHVACAGGRAVLAAGEIRFTVAGENLRVADVTNQSTGYCPPPDCWPAVARALNSAGLAAPAGFSHALVFRTCSTCGMLNVVKEGWFFCAGCEGPL